MYLTREQVEERREKMRRRVEEILARRSEESYRLLETARRHRIFECWPEQGPSC